MNLLFLRNQFNEFGFEWIDLDHRQESVIVFRRKGKLPENDVLVILNMTPVVRNNWKVYANGKSAWKEIFNSDERKYGGSGNYIQSRTHCNTGG